jgi:predicted acetyltransferase
MGEMPVSLPVCQVGVGVEVLCPLGCYGDVDIRELAGDERSVVSLPIQAYAFQPSPPGEEAAEALRRNQRYYEGNVTLVAEEGGVALADASAIPMRQNVRGVIYPMAGVAGVATLPLARRRGIASGLVTELVARMRDEGHAVSTLYPFRPSFYQRLGFVGLPRTRTVTFSPSSFGDLLRAELPGEVTWEPAEAGYKAYRSFTERLLAEQHGFSVLPEYRTVEVRDAGDRWIVMAWVDAEAVGAATYRITGHGGVLAADDMLTGDPFGRALLLQFFARHIDQVSQVEAQVRPDELPELWATDLAAVTQAITSFPASPAPMARVISVGRLAGMPVGAERVTVKVADDPFIGGTYVLDGRSGSLEVTQGAGLSPEATLTAAGLSALVYGVLDPQDVVVRGLGDIPRDPAARLRRLFPRQVPYLYARF